MKQCIKFFFVLMLLIVAGSCNDLCDMSSVTNINLNSPNMVTKNSIKPSSSRLSIVNAQLEDYYIFDTRRYAITFPYYSVWQRAPYRSATDNVYNQLFGMLGVNVLLSNTISYQELCDRVKRLSAANIITISDQIEIGFFFHPATYRWFQQHGTLSVPYVSGNVIGTGQTNPFPGIGISVTNKSTLRFTFDKMRVDLYKTNYPTFIRLWDTNYQDIQNYKDFADLLVFIVTTHPTITTDHCRNKSTIMYYSKCNFSELALQFDNSNSTSDVSYFNITGRKITDFSVMRPAGSFNATIDPVGRKGVLYGDNYDTNFISASCVNFDYSIDIQLAKHGSSPNAIPEIIHTPILSSHADITASSGYATNTFGAIVSFLKAFDTAPSVTINLFIAARLELVTVQRNFDQPSSIRFYSSFYSWFYGKFIGNYVIPSRQLPLFNLPGISGSPFYKVVGDYYSGYTSEVLRAVPDSNVYDATVVPKVRTLIYPDPGVNATIDSNPITPYSNSDY